MALSEEKTGSGRTGCPSSPRGGKISNTWSTDAMKMNNPSDEKCKPGQILQRRSETIYSDHGTSKATSSESKDKVCRITHALVQAPVFQKPLRIEAFWIRIDFLSEHRWACGLWVNGSTDLVARHSPLVLESWNKKQHKEASPDVWEKGRSTGDVIFAVNIFSDTFMW